MSTGAQDRGGGEDGGPDPEDYVDGGSIQWDDVIGAGAGAIVTAVVIVAADAFNFAVTGVFAYVDSALQGLAGFLGAPFATGEETIRSAFETGAASLEVTGPFAFPLSVAIVVASASLVIWGVYRVVGE
ncbi:MAG: hypothetical protein ACOCZD_02260 [Haloferacaceae archaeon]